MLEEGDQSITDSFDHLNEGSGTNFFKLIVIWFCNCMIIIVLFPLQLVVVSSRQISLCITTKAMPAERSRSMFSVTGKHTIDVYNIP
jgi:hypothetical protein